MPFAPGIGFADFLIVAKLASKAIKELKEVRFPQDCCPRAWRLLVRE